MVASEHMAYVLALPTSTEWPGVAASAPLPDATLIR